MWASVLWGRTQSRALAWDDNVIASSVSTVSHHHRDSGDEEDIDKDKKNHPRLLASPPYDNCSLYITSYNTLSKNWKPYLKVLYVAPCSHVPKISDIITGLRNCMSSVLMTMMMMMMMIMMMKMNSCRHFWSFETICGVGFGRNECKGEL